jgi:hypothetical protein
MSVDNGTAGRTTGRGRLAKGKCTSGIASDADIYFLASC